MDELLADFVAESREMLEALSGEIIVWEANPADRARLDAIFRFMHTVKGNCGFFDFPRLQALSHAAEDALADVRSGTRIADHALVDAVLAVVDRISDMIDAIDSGSDFPEGDDELLIAALEPRQAMPAGLSPVPGGERQARATAVQRSIRLPVDLLDRVMSGVSDMVLARNDLARHMRETPGDAAVEGAFDRLSAIIADVRNAIARTRMQRIDQLFGGLPRMVRDLSAELGKQVMIDLDGGDVELDRELIEIIRDPLTHIIRNAIDHGFETPSARLAAGKREIGLLTVSASQTGNRILIDIVDDGCGIDGDRLVEKAVAAGLIDLTAAGTLSEQQCCDLIFMPGLSTAEVVTAISGRGVGMDVVRANMERIGGAVVVESRRGQGTRMTLSVPLTLTIVAALTIGVGDQQFALPRGAVEEIMDSADHAVQISQLGDAKVVRLRERLMPCLVLRELLGLPEDSPSASPVLVVLRLTGGERFALAVDRMVDHDELVVKPVAPAIMATGLYAGATLTDDGLPVLLLEASGLAAAGRLEFDAQDRYATALPPASEEEEGDLVVLFTGIDGRRRAMPLSIVDRIEEILPAAVDRAADRLRVVVDGRLLPLAGVSDTAVIEEPLKLFRLGDGQSEIAYLIRAVGEVRVLSGEIIALDDGAAPRADAVEGIALIDGEPTEVIDPHRLFAGHAVSASLATSVGAVRTCRLPAADDWMQSFLRPLVEAAGWRVIGEDDVARADVEIAPAGAGVSAIGAARVIRLRSTPDETAEAGETVYRYDRDALLAALTGERAAGGGRR